MATTLRQVLKAYFESGDEPTQAQFEALLDSVFMPGEDGSITITKTGELDGKYRRTRAWVNQAPENRALYDIGQKVLDNGTEWVISGGDASTGWIFSPSDQSTKDLEAKYADVMPDVLPGKIVYGNREGKVFFEPTANGVKTVEQLPLFPGQFLIGNKDGKVFFCPTPDGIKTPNQNPKFPTRFLIGNKDGKVYFEPLPEGIKTPQQLPLFPGELVIGNKEGKVIFRAKGDKVEYAGQNSGTAVATNPFTGKKLGSIGDSLSAANKWQQYLADALGMDFDANLNINGADGYAAPSVGGTRVVPSGSNEIYWRIQDAHHYDFDVLPLYMGQNDTLMTLGTINDSPFISTKYFETTTSDLATAIAEIPNIERSLNHYIYYNSGINSARFTGSSFDDTTFLDISNWASTKPSFAAAYMGALEILIRNLINKSSGNKSPQIYLVTLMRYWIPKIYRNDGMVDINAMEASEREPARLNITQLIRDIGKKYGIPVIDLWNESGVTYDNANQFYPTEGNVHPSDYGYSRVMETIYKQII